MRILQIATLVSPDGAYGGPVRVAVNQARALRDLGHEASIAAASRGFIKPPSEIQGVPLHLFPARSALPWTGFAGLTSPSLHRWLIRERTHFDVVHVHLARDLVTLPAAALSRRSSTVVLQTHGMIDPSQRMLARPLDALLTRPMLKSAAAVCYLTELERTQLMAVGARPESLVELPNGVPWSPTASDGSSQEVIFLARLHPRKRPLDFVAAARELAPRHPDWKFCLVGPDEGHGGAVRQAIERAGLSNIRWEGPVAPEFVTQRLSAASVYVLPSVDEPYPMSVLEAMSVGLPVVVTAVNGLSRVVDELGTGLVTDGTVSQLTSGLEVLMNDPNLRSKMGARGREATFERFSIAQVARRLESIYHASLNGAS